MSERVLWLRLCVTGPTPECGEIVGLRIVDRQAHRTVFDAFFHPVREDGWKSVPAGGVYGQINVYGVTTKSERHKRSYWTRTADGNGIGGRKAPVPYGS